VVSGMPSASTHFVTGIRSIAKLPGPSACVLVGLPLSASGPRFGSSALMLTWSVRWSNTAGVAGAYVPLAPGRGAFSNRA
jgi:hypothetical protein